MLRELIEQIEMEKVAEEAVLLEHLAFEKLAAMRAEEILEELMEKDAKGGALARLLGRAPKKKPPLKMSFQGHDKSLKEAVKPGTKVDTRGVTETTKWNPMTQQTQKSRHVTLNTPNPQATQGVPSKWTANLQRTQPSRTQVERAQIRAAGTGY